jgi:threonine/homoserine/homoserine lactone efflux protein
VLPLWSFLAVTVPLVLTPGASTAVVLRNSLSGGARAGIQTAAGVNSGSIAYGLISAFGLAFALRRWPFAWTLLRVAGAGYLTWLALRSMHAAMAPGAARGTGTSSVDEPAPRRPLRNVYEGFLTNALNPAIASFYLVVIPQFAPRELSFPRSVLILTAIHVTLALSCHIAWAIAGGTMSRMLGRGWPRRLLDALAGLAMLTLAISMATQPDMDGKPGP